MPRVPSVSRLLASAAILACSTARGGEAVRSGQQIYSEVCIRCHGRGGVGSEAHPDALEGDHSVTQLAEVILETMPEDDPGSLTAAEANAVAAYIHEAFYSSIARARNRPARLSLARLTVRQHRQVLADLLGSFMGSVDPGDERGLRGEYFSTRQPEKGKAVAERVDPQIDFDFGRDVPLKQIQDPRTFSVTWRGSVIAPETGEYEFVVRCGHAVRLWINDLEAPLIDAWVKSGAQDEYKASLYLLGGRAYPLKLQFSKAKQGVDDSDKKKKQPPPAVATIQLRWRRPGGIPQPVPHAQLAPKSVTESFVCSESFPPDDRSYGWERGTAISAAWDQSVTRASISAADFVGRRLKELTGTDEGDSQRNDKLRAFCEEFVAGAFRTPLSEELRERYVDRQFEAAGDPEAAVRRVVLLALKSPRFLFRELGEESSYDVASRLSFGLWDSLPDEVLLKAAEQGELRSEEQLRQQAARMLKDPRAKTKLLGFLRSWLRVDSNADLSKDPHKFPEFDATAIADLRASLELFLDEIVSSDKSSYRDLLLDDKVYLNPRLAKLYDGPAVNEVGFEKVKIDGGRRAGVLTHPYVMAHFAHGRESSPIHRGVFLARGVLGKLLRPPPQAFTPLPAELHPDLTTRERVAEQTKAAECMSCHTVINPLGFTLERFDAIGNYREFDNGKPIDDAASYPLPSGEKLTLDGARDLAEFLASNDQCHGAFVEQLFHHLVQQPAAAYGPDTVDRLRARFAENDLNIRALAIEIMTMTAGAGRESGKESPAAPTADRGKLVESH